MKDPLTIADTYRREKIRRRWMVGVTICVAIFIMTVVGKCSIIVVDSVDQDTTRAKIRRDNGGAIPDKELLSSNGRVYQVVTFPERPGVTCIHNSSRRMGCWKE